MPPKVLQDNLGVDLVIKYKIPSSGIYDVTSNFQKLIRTLAEIHLETEVRAADDSSLFIFVKAGNNEAFTDVIYRSRIRDWLHGVRQIQPTREAVSTLTETPLSESERLRMIHAMITSQRMDGGANITPKHGEWKNVEAIFPLHNHERNKKWLADFTKKTFLTPEDLDHVRDAVGEKSYFQFLTFPAAFGASIWLLLGNFSPIYMIGVGMWSVVFIEYWKRQEIELSVRWGVKNVGTLEARRREFRPEKVHRDPITGEDMALFPAKERFRRQLLQVPLAIASAIALGIVICTCYSIEVFISEIYSGPLKSLLVFTPTVLLTVCVPIVSGFLTKYAEQLNNYENYETQSAHDKAMVSKVFVINFITSYLAMFLTSFVYIPFASVLVPYLDVFSLTVRPFAENEKQTRAPPMSNFSINPQRLPNQMFFFAVTSQIISLATETIVPILTRKGQDKVEALKASALKRSSGTVPSIAASDHAEEKDFLARVREEADLPEYDVTADLREMSIQFGYLVLFSVVWPLTPVAYFVNNWFELRADTFKLTIESRRPVPQRADSIGPWLDSLEFLAWLGSITSAALVHMFSNGGLGPDGRPNKIHFGYLMLSVFFSEHIFLIFRNVVRYAIHKLDSGNMRKERSERFMVRRKFLEDAGLGDAVKPLTSPGDSALKTMNTRGSGISNITRQSLEEDARYDSLRDTDDMYRFWNRQRGWEESETVGMRLIEMIESNAQRKTK
ncbi:hypothetical protein LTS08_001468 [Lithohypha guttulata]|uniref:Anoctamin n=1 Tax=Lithohypha guttulata TaxID=1690604 RepID=A0AAN7SVN6_9EURO|nr:hypothetical protein LTR05_007518 [Lithohypha guttulata]KAK5105194.1 hypothetical protein LTS08_001468 [Lithohypha guttulata]